MDIISAFFEFLIFTVIVKGIVAHSIADFIMKMVKKWLNANPQRLAHYEAILHQERRKLLS